MVGGASTRSLSSRWSSGIAEGSSQRVSFASRDEEGRVEDARGPHRRDPARPAGERAHVEQQRFRAQRLEESLRIGGERLAPRLQPCELRGMRRRAVLAPREQHAGFLEGLAAGGDPQPERLGGRNAIVRRAVRHERADAGLAFGLAHAARRHVPAVRAVELAAGEYPEIAEGAHARVPAQQQHLDNVPERA
jgi:hypothetical protein